MEKKSSPLSSTALINTPSNDFLEKEKNPLKRHLFKTISYRIMATSITISTALILGLDIVVKFAKTLIKPITVIKNLIDIVDKTKKIYDLF